ncbi:hypothetical protein M422DRAFT_69174 [Sphaerobolus stellatus SS14]|uniref:Unplaced genomic scaffold SPHSTscaffold_89, whole genome shotgun sequence n=1 Tax=Sphaerobolus stellatus (strain SS14) TaxID=990650 RepID=A0A0C9UA38_SPHS4|nr:hypothetical protein M422DRAFT_70877 [Sphaerobolus stellatus SS14]KIJ38050.1 hypothetical protein M422DRAFT_69174 [Sphaerobolus stellatus SS14]
MTRTERSTSKDALVRDRSLSKNGKNKSDPKGGAGGHNWGSFADEQELEWQARLDNDEEGVEPDQATETKLRDAVLNKNKPQVDGSLTERTESALSEVEINEARKFRAQALKNGADLGSIARTSAAVSTSPPGRTTSTVVATDATTGTL